MADGITHRNVGQITGAGFALYRARHQDPLAAAFEALGGWYGGRHGARIHDVLEPATTPNHRGACHSIAANGAVIALGKDALDALHADLRSWADEQAQHALAPEMPWYEALLRLVGAAGAHMLVGYTNGVAAGAVSHLALDAPTAAGIPLLVRGF